MDRAHIRAAGILDFIAGVCLVETSWLADKVPASHARIGVWISDRRKVSSCRRAVNHFLAAVFGGPD